MRALRSFPGVCCLCLAALIPNYSRAQTDYPVRPIRFIVPFTPGGVSDMLARSLAEPLTKALGQQVVMDFRPGAGGRIGLEVAAKSATDGYTIFLGAQGTLAVGPSLYRQLPYNPDKDFAAVVLLVRASYLLLINPGVPANNLKELLSLLASKPGQFSFASVGTGTSGHFAGELLKRRIQADIVHVPYKGESPALTSLMGGETQLMFSLPVAPAPHIKGGRLKAIAIAAPRRSALFPEVPTLDESGLPEFEVSTWFSMMTRAGVPSAIVTRLNAEINRILRMEDVRARLMTLGMEPAGGSISESAVYIRSERAKWARIIKDTGVTAD
jgi:tripartite-type tricarboxylate transporter receptor subunit TctC